MPALKLQLSQDVIDYFDGQSKLSKISKSDLINDILAHYIAGKSFDGTLDRILVDLYK